MATQTTAASPQQLIDAAKKLTLAYNEKNWNAIRANITPNFVYDEVPTRRNAQGADQTIALWQGWAKAFPDSRATIHSGIASGTTVVLELTWQGTHNGPLETPNGPLAPTGKRIEVRACQVTEMAGEKAKAQRHYFDMATLLQQLGAKG
ncbi:MAG TPA: ester cyclase [Gemmatimonadales bacterium]|jgi:steroid delta-isomerase-like uncharacterized protein|nr:ester cyclase [Gemmatimonadales bacterium]